MSWKALESTKISSCNKIKICQMDKILTLMDNFKVYQVKMGLRILILG